MFLNNISLKKKQTSLKKNNILWNMLSHCQPLKQHPGRGVQENHHLAAQKLASASSWAHLHNWASTPLSTKVLSLRTFETAAVLKLVFHGGPQGLDFSFGNVWFFGRNPWELFGSHFVALELH